MTKCSSVGVSLLNGFNRLEELIPLITLTLNEGMWLYSTVGLISSPDNHVIPECSLALRTMWTSEIMQGLMIPK